MGGEGGFSPAPPGPSLLGKNSTNVLESSLFLVPQKSVNAEIHNSQQETKQWALRVS